MLAFFLLGSSAAHLAAQNLILAELMAANSSGLKDVDGDFSDWIELFNPEATPVSLAGWYLSDDASNLTRWQFPDVTIPSQGFLLVFASGKNRTDPARELHTDFKLGRDGDYLALVRPDGRTITSAFSPRYPRQVSDTSYGRAMTTQIDSLIGTNSVGRLFVPSDDSLGQTWQLPEFADSSWRTVAMPVGYDRPEAGSPEPPEQPPQLADMTQPDDLIVPTSLNSPVNEDVLKAIDNNPQTKYLNFDKLNAGFTVTPSTPGKVVVGLRLTSANDAPDRDPTSYLLSGSNDGKTFAEIARGNIPNFTARFMPVTVSFANTQAYAHYRLLFPTVRTPAAAVAVQIAEVELLAPDGPSTEAFGELIETDVEESLYNRNSSAYLRVPFTVDTVPTSGRLTLRMRYEDGFVAFLNGEEVARANAPENVIFNSAADTNRLRSSAVIEQSFNLTAFASLIRPGANVLAIQGINSRVDSRDFLLEAKLENVRITLGELGYFQAPSPGKENQGVGGLVDEVTFSQSRGFFENPFDLTLSCPTEAATIRYTTNGSAPSANSGFVYSGPIRLTQTTTFRAAAFRDGWRPSRVATRSYLFLNDVVLQSQASALAAGLPATWIGQAADYGLDPRIVAPGGKDSYGGKYARSLKADLQSLPSISLVTAPEDLFGPQGIYANPESRGSAWERATSVELIYPDGTRGFQADAGIRIQGGAFRRFDLTLKKSFRVVFREQYGPTELKFPLFGADATDHFDGFVLRANSNDAWPYGGAGAVYVRDAFAMDTARAMGMIASHSTFAHLYINGQYWGLYNPVERPDAGFSSTYRGGNKEDWDSINQDSTPDGNYDAWNRLMTLLNQNQANEAAFQRLQGNNPDGTRNPAYDDLLDVENMIDYMILNFYVGNTDWPGRNWWAGRDRNHGDGFHFYPWDTETALGLNGSDINVTGVDGAVARPYAAGRANAGFRLWFADHVHRHFFNGGALYVNPAKTAWDPTHPEDNRPAARFVALAELVRRGMVGESARWGNQLQSGPFTRDEHWQTARDSLLRSFFPQRSARVLDQLRQAGLYPRTAAPLMSQHGGVVPLGFPLSLRTAQGIIYYTLDGSDPRSPGALRYTSPIPLADLTHLKTRTLNGTEWSALEEATFIVGHADVVLSELHYHPADPSTAERAAGFNNSDDFEFIELYNRGDATADLTGMRFINGIQFNFTGSAITQLPAGAYVLVVKDRDAFELRYGKDLPVAGTYTGRLDNAGEKIELVNAAGQPVFAFTYETLPPWPATADGDGFSLEVVDPTGNLNLPETWRPSNAFGGSPGQPNSLPPIVLEAATTEGGRLQLRFDGRAGLGYTVLLRGTRESDSWQVIQRGNPLPSNQSVELQFELDGAPDSRLIQVSIP